MSFTTLSFVGFVALVLAVYYLIPKRLQWVWLLAASLFFYVSLARKMLVFVLFSGLWAHGAAQLIFHLHQREKQALQTADPADKKACKRCWLARRRLVLFLFLGGSIALLLLLKFYNVGALILANYGLRLPFLRLALPLGISFYTLQLAGYVLDVYNKQAQPEKNPFKTLLFTSYFPQIVQGPISRFSQLHPQLVAPHAFDYDAFVLGFQRVLWGYFKKLVIADRFAILTRTLFENYDSYPGFYIAVLAVVFTLQMYADFSGGIDIALGISQMLGITQVENFLRPFFSKSIQEFWRRWHITLGTWLRDYLFYPLTLSHTFGRLRKFFARHDMPWAAKWIPAYLALLALWLASGIWHGEGLQYILYGLWHGSLIMVGTSMEKPAAAFLAALRIPPTSQTLKLFRMVRTFSLVALGELIFGAAGLAGVLGLLRALFSAWNPWILLDGSLLQLGLDGKDMLVGVLALLVLLAASLLSRQTDLRQWIYRQELPLRWGILLSGIASVAVFGIYGPEYDPTPFIYYQF